jgi:hypothetical protein
LDALIGGRRKILVLRVTNHHHKSSQISFLLVAKADGLWVIASDFVFHDLIFDF